MTIDGTLNLIELFHELVRDGSQTLEECRAYVEGQVDGSSGERTLLEIALHDANVLSVFGEHLVLRPNWGSDRHRPQARSAHRRQNGKRLPPRSRTRVGHFQAAL